MGERCASVARALDETFAEEIFPQLKVSKRQSKRQSKLQSMQTHGLDSSWGSTSRSPYRSATPHARSRPPHTASSRLVAPRFAPSPAPSPS